MNEKVKAAGEMAQTLNDHIDRYDEVKAALIARRGKRYALAVITTVDLSISILSLHNRTDSILEKMVLDHMGKDAMHLGFLSICEDSEVLANAPSGKKLDDFVDEMRIVGEVRQDMINAAKHGLDIMKG